MQSQQISDNNKSTQFLEFSYSLHQVIITKEFQNAVMGEGNIMKQYGDDEEDKRQHAMAVVT